MAKAHRRVRCDPPAGGVDFDGVPLIIGEVEIELVVERGYADVRRALGRIKLRLGADDGERRHRQRLFGRESRHRIFQPGGQLGQSCAAG